MKYLSILIPSYNVEDYLANTLDSLLIPGIIDDIEVIIVDDGSTDKTPEIADSYHEKYPDTVVVVHKENGGYGSGLNTAIGLEQTPNSIVSPPFWKGAEGRYLCVIDGDDRASGAIQQIVTAAKMDTSIDMIAYDGKIVDLNGNTIARENLTGLKPGINNLNELPSDTPLALGIHNIAISLTILRDNNVICHHNHFYVDHEFVLYPLQYCRNVYYVNEPLYIYTIGREGQSVSLEGRKRHFDDYMEVYAWIIDYYEKNKPSMSASMRQLYLNEISNHIIGVYGFYLLCNDSTHKASLCAFDKKLKQDSNDVYSDMAKSLSIKMLRLTNFSLYKLAAWAYVNLYAKKRYQM